MRTLACGLIVLAAAMPAGCYAPNPGFMTSTGDPQTYYSTEMLPTTLTLVDTRTEEPIFSIEVPVGQQITVQFAEGAGDDPVNTPDQMRYQIMKRGTRFGLLENSLTVPNQYCRRLDISYREAPEAEPPPPDAPIRADQERPAWWTPEGGPLPARNPQTMDRP